ncbi:SUMO1 sentrin specific peptidase 8 [Chytriomyces hyalinus]|nr:SUMO1 sentrin specific peptidase 8 [Chytriomyces hyalinus]
MDDPIVASLCDASLRSSDVHLINGPHWINDAVIAYAFELLLHPSSSILMTPAVAHLLVNLDQESALGLSASMSLDKAETVFIPVNDSTELDSPGGSHWSLLVYSRAANAFFYYDSLNKYNISAAKRVQRRFAKLIQKHKGDAAPYFQEMDVQAQINGYDCGMYVIAMTQLLLSRVSATEAGVSGKPGDQSLWRMRTCLTPETVAKTRVWLYEKVAENARMRGFLLLD